MQNKTCCNGEECRQRYSQNKERHKEKTSIRKNKSKQENRRNAYQYLSKHPCVDCGEIDARCLEFDHVRGEKKNNISSMMKNVCAWETILEEISKCDVRCANCHRKRTSDVQGWYKSL